MDVQISLIIPIYNVEAYIEKCINSVLNQTYKNLDIILVDDGSTDSSPSICNAFEKKDSRVRVIHKKNGGLSDARNTGLEAARGDYVLFIDGDDFIHPNMVELLWREMEHQEADIAVCSFLPVSESQSVEFELPAYVPKLYTNMESLQCLFEESARVLMTVAWNKLYRKSLFDKIRYPFQKLHEDEFTTYKLLHLSKRTVLIELPLYYYVQRESSIMGTGFRLKSLDKLDALLERMLYFKENELSGLYTPAFYDYLNDIIYDYFSICKHLPNETTVLADLHSRFYNDYYEYSKAAAFPFKRKIRFLLFHLSPALYKKILLKNF